MQWQIYIVTRIATTTSFPYQKDEIRYTRVPFSNSITFSEFQYPEGRDPTLLRMQESGLSTDANPGFL